MPISSGAKVKDGKDSYLKRYYRTLPEEKRKMIEKSLTNANNSQAHKCEEGHGDVPSQVPEPVKENIQHRNKADGEDGEDPEGSGVGEPSAKKSSTCIVL